MSSAKFSLSTTLALIAIFLLSACGNQTSPNGPINVKVTLKEFTIQSSLTDFKPGVQYHFVITNSGKIPHEFMIMPVTMDGMDMSGGMSGMSMDDKDKLALMMIPEEQLAPGATVEKDYTFTSAPKGKIEIVCTLPAHFEAGMRMPVSIR